MEKSSQKRKRQSSESLGRCTRDGQREVRRSSPFLSDGHPAGFADMYLPIKDSKSIPKALLVQQLLQRLSSTGFKYAALTHIVYGCPSDPQDRIGTTFGDHRKHQTTIFPPDSSLKILYRVHCVVENLSDVAVCSAEASDLLREYDIVSISPRTEAAFQVACSTTKESDRTM